MKIVRIENLWALVQSLEEERDRYRDALKRIKDAPIALVQIPTHSAYNQGVAFQIALEALEKS